MQARVPAEFCIISGIRTRAWACALTVWMDPSSDPPIILRTYACLSGNMSVDP